ncbi:toxin-antitoxin system HicB family antitoxin [Deinococcus psychrotolerans]|uniref:Toxin-antitoxin system HicB family antitoxin n=1 Tax=Deinococcus psychrotolerans TaxID=2489213 RepID=A0A3G8YKY3_9DEIO|nr:toxin-antitoxin system HicB family antitoxin [Deinococcus psychrotolerans]AZI43244.1 toxin-antitoxin system HicB family antitoxin [Deinococcus psychrotolerans]
MTALSVRLPDSLHLQLKLLAQQEGVSINQLVTLAVAEKVTALKTEDYLLERAAKGNREAFLAVLAKAPKVEPSPEDRLL